MGHIIVPPTRIWPAAVLRLVQLLPNTVFKLRYDWRACVDHPQTVVPVHLPPFSKVRWIRCHNSLVALTTLMGVLAAFVGILPELGIITKVRVITVLVALV